MSQYQERVLGAPVPDQWIERYETLSKQTGRSLTELVREAIAQYIGVTEKSVFELEQEIADLKQKLTQMEPYQQQLNSLNTRLQILEKLTPQPAKRSSGVAPSSPLDDDDIDDEPDEILTDFLPQ